MRQFIYFLAALLLTVSCEQPKPDIIEPETRGGITGVVADKTTGEPVPTVNVKLKETGSSSITGSDGSFSFKDLDNGSYTVLLSKEGYNDNSSTVQISNGRTVESHFLIERIPAVLTIDREVLDFGDNYSNTMLSFSIVNKNYVDLDWEIVYSCRWIKQIDPMKSITKLGFGKTQTIVVIIDRDALMAGDNETVIVVRTSDGASELKIKAYGVPKRLPALNMAETSDITSSTAVLNAAITDKGFPEYSERGFVLSYSEMPTIENCLKVLPAAVDTQNVFSVRASDLEMGKTYYARAYARNTEGTAYSTNQEQFKTLAELPSVSILVPTDIDSYSAVLHGAITDEGSPAYTERGFVLGIAEMPTLETAQKVFPVTKNEQDEYSVRAGDLALGQTYFVRAYAINAVGVALSTGQEQFTTLAVLPSVKIISTTDIQSTSAVLNASITNQGIPAYTERGFVLGDTEMPTKETALMVLPVAMDSHDNYSIRVGSLSLGKTYYVRAFVVNAFGIAYSSTMDKFTTVGKLPVVSTQAATDEDRETKTAVLHASIAFEGDPAYTERGFVWSTTYESPTIEEEKIVISGSGTGNYEKRVSFPAIDKTIYARAFATNQQGTAYGESIGIFPIEYIVLNGLNIGVQKNDAVRHSTWSDADAICKNSRVGGLEDWRLPTKDEMYQLYLLRNDIGEFWSYSYWTSTYGGWDKYGDYYYTIYFSRGSSDKTNKLTRDYIGVRCVRTLQ